MGQKIYILTSPDDVGTIYKNNTSLSWDAMLNDLLIGFGIQAAIIPRLWLPIETTNPGKSADNAAKVTPRLSVLHSTLDLYKRQLLPGANFEQFGKKLLQSLNSALCWESLADRYELTPSGRLEGVSLKGLCDVILVDAITRTLFGDGIYEIEPNLTKCLLDFNDGAWMLVFKYPLAGVPKLQKSRDNILKALANYLKAPSKVRLGQSWLIKSVMEDLNAVDVDDKNGAALLLMIYWG